MASQQRTKHSKSKLDALRERSAQAEQGGGAARVEKQHEAGKMTARERIEFLLDEGSFEEFDKLVVHRSKDFGLDKQLYPGDGVITGHGLIDGRRSEEQRLNSSHSQISYAVFCLKKKKN